MAATTTATDASPPRPREEPFSALTALQQLAVAAKSSDPEPPLAHTNGHNSATADHQLEVPQSQPQTPQVKQEEGGDNVAVARRAPLEKRDAMVIGAVMATATGFPAQSGGVDAPPLPKLEPDAAQGQNSVQDRAEDPAPEASLPPPRLSMGPSSETKKRSAPKADRKKGTANAVKKPAKKKRKVEPTGGKAGTPSSQRSGTPAVHRKASIIKGEKQGSATPSRSSPPIQSVEQEEDNGEEEEDEEQGSSDIDETQIFCVCRKPDDHRWMIGCDGGCEDWFHGRCVGMDEKDGKLIDKYICPNCAKKNVGITSWKPMCRLEGCRDPARASGARPSKYCCDEHGEEFMRRQIARKYGDSSLSDVHKRRKSNYTDNIGNADESDREEEPDNRAYLRGGLLKPSELKSLALGVDDIDEFRALGSSASKTRRVKTDRGAGSDQPPQVEEDEEDVPPYSETERSRLEAIDDHLSTTRHNSDALKDRERFLGLLKGRAKRVLEELRRKDKSVKDICGFDERLSWSDQEFDDWRTSVSGKKALESGNVEPKALAPVPNPDGNGTLPSGNDHSQEETTGGGVCLKKRCERHKTWFKLHSQDTAFELDQCRQKMAKLEREAKTLKERAKLKVLDSDGMAGNEVTMAQ